MSHGTATSAFQRVLFYAVALCILSTIAANLINRKRPVKPRSEPSPISALSARDAPLQAPRPTDRIAQAGNRATIEADRSGHYRTEARIDGAAVPVLVDTGATLVSLSEDAARSLGLVLGDADFKYGSATANGFVKVAVVTLREVQVGSVRVHDVKASVHRGSGLSTNLLGMSFLNRLSRVEAAQGRLILRQ